MGKEYVAIIYFRNGNKIESGTFAGPGAEQSAERWAITEFNQYMKTAINEFFEPTRYVVKKI